MLLAADVFRSDSTERSQTTSHLQTQTSTDKNRRLCSPGRADVVISSCRVPTLSSHSPLTYFLLGSLPWPHSPASDPSKRKRTETPADRHAANPLSSVWLLPFLIYFLIAWPAAYMKKATRLHWHFLSFSPRILSYWLENRIYFVNFVF